ncbi:AlpA family transcriptional regulator [Escherichia coli]|uniref:helix-turn-helix transcriptional regulator n=1 Tax=Escherichia coli TaxID=562 RepID=UPI001C7D9FD4|nr:AlpA family transcriptional regulator [Escherichia coli]MCZ0410513.1 AlpA family transcriptional regulator [Escherichia coli]HBB5098319.1 AlpA family transcriptional regulator [Escherichia coli]
MSTQTGHFYTPSRILRMAELTRLLGISRSTIYEKMNPASKYYDATFPRPVRLGSSAVGWRASAIDEWLTLHTTPTRTVTKDK